MKVHHLSFSLASGDVAQLGERRLCKAEVRGSSPLISTELSGDDIRSGVAENLLLNSGSGTK